MIFNLACGRRIIIMIASICILKLEVLRNRVHKRLKITPSILNLKLKVVNEPQGLISGLRRETGNKIDFQQNSKKKASTNFNRRAKKIKTKKVQRCNCIISVNIVNNFCI